MKIALLSNVNVDPVCRLLKKSPEIELYDTQGYGNELGTLLDKNSSLYAFHPKAVFLVIDVMEVIRHELDVKRAEDKISEWFHLFESSLQNDMVYYVSDAYVYGAEMGVVADYGVKLKIEQIWMDCMERLSDAHSCVRQLGYRRLVEQMGERHVFSAKMWYMGKILYSVAFQQVLAHEIEHKVQVELSAPKKVLLLDLDNTLWGGLAGEHSSEPIILSDEGAGLAYKNFQRVLSQMRRQGVILGVVSKNNEKDAMDLILNHPHMVLSASDFSAVKINWQNKNENIVQIADELNLGLDAIVFMDDSPAERALIKETLPDVAVPDFPEQAETLADAMTEIYRRYFEKPLITKEDRRKTEFYRANRERKRFRMQAADFDSYLDGLEMKLIRVSGEKNTGRLIQLVNKTNQFNLTTRRYSDQEMADILQEEDKEVFLYQIVDKFGDNGIVAASIVEYGEEAVISEFTMSCRVMGRCIENAIVEDMEYAARSRGYDALTGIYRASEKNQPTEGLYASLGYERRKVNRDGSIDYVIKLDEPLSRHYRLTRQKEED